MPRSTSPLTSTQRATSCEPDEAEPGQARPDHSQPSQSKPGRSEWPADWMRGVLAVCVLHLLADGPTYGYALATRIEEVGLGTVKGGTLYPLLGRLEDAGHVDVEWRPGTSGPGRKYFFLTALGRQAAKEQSDAWCAFARLTTTLLTGDLAAAATHSGGTTR